MNWTGSEEKVEEGIRKKTKYEHQPIRSSFPSPTATEEEPGGIVSDDPNCWMEEEKKKSGLYSDLIMGGRKSISLRGIKGMTFTCGAHRDEVKANLIRCYSKII